MARSADYRINFRQGGLGDTLIVSALVRDLAAHFPDIRLSIYGSGSAEIFERDARLAPVGRATTRIKFDYAPTVDRARTDRSARYVFAPHEAFARLTGVSVPRGSPTPDIVLGSDELYRHRRPYGVVAAGTKGDMPVKSWVLSRFAEVVADRPDLDWLQVGAVGDSRCAHRQTAIPGCVNLIGKTSIRQLFAVIASSRVVVGHVSLPMLVSSAFGVPCVVIGGGREEPWMHEAPRVRYLHTIGQLDCCEASGCRRSVARPPHGGPLPPNWACSYPTDFPDFYGGTQSVGRCMDRIAAADVLAAIETFAPTASE